MTRRRKVILAVAALAVGVAAALFALVAIPPVDDELAGSDAVVVHSGGHGERLHRALRLMRDGVAPTLVVMFGGTEQVADAGELCGQTEPYEVICPEPEPVSTIGEAREVGALVDERGWDRVVIVTTDYHVRRTKTLVDRCTDAEVLATSGPNRIDTLDLAWRYLHEMGGMVQALTFTC